jgi:hypothetical protein
MTPLWSWGAVVAATVFGAAGAGRAAREVAGAGRVAGGKGFCASPTVVVSPIQRHAMRTITEFTRCIVEGSPPSKVLCGRFAPTRCGQCYAV